MTSILVAEEQSGFFNKLFAGADTAQPNTISFSSSDSLVGLLEDHSNSGIIIVGLNSSRSVELIKMLEALWKRQLELPYYAILCATEKRRSEAFRYLNDGVHDLLIDPLNLEYLHRKLLIANQLVADKRTLIESSKVLERYAKHIDSVAAERARQLFHAERLSTLGTMSAGLAHELNTPIGYISTSFETTKLYWEKIDQNLRQVLQEGQKLDRKVFMKALDSVPRALARIDIGLEKITKLTGNLKKFAHASKEERADTSLNCCLRMALEMCESALNGKVELEIELSDELPLIRVNSQQIEQVFVNLLVNASHALEGREHAKVRVQTSLIGNGIEALVEDNGPGIPEEHLQTIFEPFYTTKGPGKGTGLGLAISHSLIKDNGGEILVENKPDGGGARFRIRFALLG